MKILRLCAVGLMLGGCSLVPNIPETQVTDTFCLQKKRKWSINDSVESIRDAEVHNSTLDRKCGVKKSA